MLYELGLTLVKTVGYKMRVVVVAVHGNTNSWVRVLILTILLQSPLDAKNPQVKKPTTTKVPDAAGNKVRMSSEYFGYGI